MTEELTPEEEAQLLDAYTQQNTDDYVLPSSPTKDSVLQFFRDVLKMKDSQKFANLLEKEIGQLKKTVRTYIDIAKYNTAVGKDQVSSYLMGKAETVLATSLSRKGFFPQLTVTQIKKEQKLSSGVEQKKPWFSFGKQQPPGEQQ